MKNLKVLFFVTLFTLISIDTSLFCMNQELKNNTESHQEQASFLGKFSDIAADVFYSMERSEQNQYELIGYQKKSEDIKVTTKKGKVIIELEDPIIHKNPKRGFLKNCFKLVNPCKTFLHRKILELCKKKQSFLLSMEEILQRYHYFLLALMRRY